MKNRKEIIFVILSLLSHSLLFSSPADTASIIDNIFNYDFVKASGKLSSLYEKNPLISETMNLEIKWWMAIEKGDKNHFSEFLIALNQFEKKPNTDIAVIISSAYRMRYYACTNKSYLVPIIFLKTESRIKKVEMAYLVTSDREEYELFMLYRSFLTLIRNSYFPDILLSDSHSKQKLIADIEEVISNGSSPNKTMGRYFMMKYYLDIEKDKPKAFGYLSELHKLYPNNLIFTQLLTN